MAVKLLVTSDFHLGRRSAGLPESTSTASAIDTWHRTVEMCMRRKVDVVLLAGDIIDRENYFFESISPFVKGLDTLAQANIPTCMVTGNHDFDVLNDAVQQSDSNEVHLLGTDGDWQRKVLDLQEGEVQVMGRSFTSSTLTSDPLLDFETLEVDSGIPSVGIVHGEVDQSHSNYGPIDRNRLVETRLDAWFIGHIHKPELLREQNPLICYPGSPHAFNAGERGLHGPWIVHIDEDRSVSIEQLSLSPIRYETVDVDITEIKNKNEFREHVITRLTDLATELEGELDEVRYLIYDVRIVGSSAIPEQMREWGEEVVDFYDTISSSDVMISVRKVKTHLSPSLEGLEEWRQQDNPAGVLADILVKLQDNETDETIEELVDQWRVELERVNRSEVFRPLRKEGRQLPANQKTALEAIRKECEKLLLKLIHQQQSEKEA